MNIYKKVILEVGVNHLGNLKEANKILNFFLQSKFKSLTFMIQTKDFYKKMNKKRIDYKLPASFYSNAIKLAHKKNKKIGLAVWELKTCDPFLNLNFDFYKLLGISINNKNLIAKLRNKKKHVYISLAQGSDFKIKKCLKYFNKKTKLSLIYTVRSYNPNHLDLNRIFYLKNKFKISVGYGHHYTNSLPIYLSSLFSPSFYFLYIKNFTKKNKLFPDNDHAFFTNKLIGIVHKLQETMIILKKKKSITTKVNITSITKKKF